MPILDVLSVLDDIGNKFVASHFRWNWYPLIHKTAYPAICIWLPVAIFTKTLFLVMPELTTERIIEWI